MSILSKLREMFQLWVYATVVTSSYSVPGVSNHSKASTICMPPKGDYVGTCLFNASDYRSSDPRLAGPSAQRLLGAVASSP